METELRQIVRTAPKSACEKQEYKCLSGEVSRQRCLSCFQLDTIVVVKVEAAVNHFIGFGKCSRFMAVDAFCFENGEEIFRHRVVIRIPQS